MDATTTWYKNKFNVGLNKAFWYLNFMVTSCIKVAKLLVGMIVWSIKEIDHSLQQNLVVNPITFNNFSTLFNCTLTGRASDLMMATHVQFSWLGLDVLSLVTPTGVQLLDFCCFGISVLVLLLYSHYVSSQCWIMIWAATWKNLFLPYANNKGADQPAHIHCLESIILLVSIFELSSL